MPQLRHDQDFASEITAAPSLRDKEIASGWIQPPNKGEVPVTAARRIQTRRREQQMGSLLRAAIVACAVAQAACGGGGAGAPGPTTPTAPTPPSTELTYPILVKSGAFSLPAIADPAERQVVMGTQQGRVLVAPGRTASAGLTVEWLDASIPTAPVVLATGTTQDDGGFVLPALTVAAAPTDQWLRVALADGTVMRAYATGWVDLNPASEAMVREMSRLRKAGAFAAHILARSELAGAQESLTLWWLGSTETRTPAAAAAAMVEELRTFGPWNALLDRFSQNTVSQGSGDIAGLMPVGGAQWPSTVTRAESVRSVIFDAYDCSGLTEPLSCSIRSLSEPYLSDPLQVRNTGLSRGTVIADAPDLRDPLEQVTSLPLIEFPLVVGTAVVYEQPRLNTDYARKFGAAVKVTRRTYPLESMQALGRTIQAVQVVLDIEAAVLNRETGLQTELLLRERRWFSPRAGRVGFEALALARSGRMADVAAGTTAIARSAVSVAADSVSGNFYSGPPGPFAGVADVRALGLRHRHAVYSAALNRIYVATSRAGGEILELDPGTLATLRTLSTPAVPGRIALSSDGTQLYAGLDGGELVQWRVADLALVRRSTVPRTPYGEQYRRFCDLAVDPFDSERVLALACGVVLGNSGALLVYRRGTLVVRDSPRVNWDDFGWSYYSPNAVSWSSVRDEYLAASLGSPKFLYRFRANEATSTTTELSALLRVEDLGWVEAGGSILTGTGQSIDPQTFAAGSALALPGHVLTGCNRQDAATAVCQSDIGPTRPVLVRLDHATSAFLGAYRPTFGEVISGCTNTAYNFSIGPDIQSLTPMSGGQSLVSALALDAEFDEKCSLQVWTLHGVP